MYAAAISAAAVSVYGVSVGAANASTPAANSGSHTVAVAHSSTAVSGTPSPKGTKGLCGTKEGVWTNDGITAQNGAPTNPSLNTWGAKQIKCKKLKKSLKVHQLVIDGYPSQSVDINFNVDVYKSTKKFDTVRYTNDPQPNDAKGTICSYTDAPGTYSATGVTTAQWTVNLPKTCKISPKLAKKGVWFALQADYDQAGGQWFWATQTTADVPNEADWADTQNLFGLGCISFAKPPSGSDIGASKDMQDCLFSGDVGEKDFILVLH
jgi:hypothetical protein